jgi:hypothetical protein
MQKPTEPIFAPRVASHSSRRYRAEASTLGEERVEGGRHLADRREGVPDPGLVGRRAPGEGRLADGRVRKRVRRKAVHELLKLPHPLALVGLRPDAVLREEVGSERSVARGREALGDVLDVGVDAPDLLDHDDARDRALGPFLAREEAAVLVVASVADRPTGYGHRYPLRAAIAGFG